MCIRDRIYTIAWSPSGAMIATGSNDKLIKIMRPFSSVESDVELKGHSNTVRTLCFAKDETFLFSAGAADNHVKVWDLASLKPVHIFEGHKDAIYSIQIDGEKGLLFSGGFDRTVKLWDLRRRNYIAEIPTDVGINHLALTPAGIGKTLIAAAHVDGSISLLDFRELSRLETLRYHQDDCRSVDFDSKGERLLSSSFDRTIGVYSLATRSVVAMLTNHGDKVVSARWHPSDEWLISTSADCSARLFRRKGDAR
eukprot:TRINITY_DN8611_c0_g2_i2.p1 TRINITY_DN8611_c0_g2~~TRINITY_DN8611_c0_g2_i2.p1  ORF type:complete len:269 (-),score=17.55 TRINITY_DN8611_c0_g2_i2:133-891(-)